MRRRMFAEDEVCPDNSPPGNVHMSLYSHRHICRHCGLFIVNALRGHQALYRPRLDLDSRHRQYCYQGAPAPLQVFPADIQESDLRQSHFPGLIHSDAAVRIPVIGRSPHQDVFPSQNSAGLRCASIPAVLVDIGSRRAHYG